MANTQGRGKSFSLLLLSLLFILSSAPVTHSSSVSLPQPEPESGNELMTQQEVLLQRMEELTRNLSELVSRLEPLLSEPPPSRLAGVIHKRSGEDAGENQGKREVGDNHQPRNGEKLKSISVTKYSPLWSERFQFVSAVKLDSEATCVSVLPFRDLEGLSKYVAVGDDGGRVYVFMRNGDVLVEFDTLVNSPVTAIVAYLSVYKNESVVVTGHQNGEIIRHKIVERSNGEESTTLVMENVGKMLLPENRDVGLAVPVRTLEVHHVGRLRYILSSDASGMIRVFKEDGKFHGSVMPSSRPIAFLKQRLLFLTESGAGSLDLRSMKIRESECEGLNHTLVRNYVFDVTERSKAYGFTSDGSLIHVLLLGDMSNFKCRVRSKKKFDMDEPIAMQTIKGYLLIVNEDNVYVYNVSSHHYVRAIGPRLIFPAGLDEIRSSFLNYQSTGLEIDSKRGLVPLIATDREKLVVLGLGGGYVGMYSSSLPVFKGEFNTMLWTSPVLIFILFLFGAWQFFAKKKEALTSWGPDDPFTNASSSSSSAPNSSSSPPLGGGPGDRSFVEPSSRKNPGSGIMDLRADGIRGPPRRYASPPPRYAGGTTSSFRPSSVVEVNPSRPSSVDPPNYRTSSELKYRASHMEPPGFPKRRENMYVNNQVVDDGN